MNFVPKSLNLCQNLVGRALGKEIFVARDKIGTKMFMGGVRTKCIFYLDGWIDGLMDGWMLLFVNELIPRNPKWSERASRNENFVY
jgi:hypothetical protein